MALISWLETEWDCLSRKMASRQLAWMLPLRDLHNGFTPSIQTLQDLLLHEPEVLQDAGHDADILLLLKVENLSIGGLRPIQGISQRCFQVGLTNVERFVDKRLLQVLPHSFFILNLPHPVRAIDFYIGYPARTIRPCPRRNIRRNNR